MFHTRSFYGLVLCAVCALALAACSGSATPQLIGSYPKGASPTYAPPPENLLVVYDDYLELEVSNTDTAADRATRLASDYGGYLVSSQSWYQGGRKYTTLTLAVPVAQFEATRKALLRLGTLVSENVSGDLISTRYGADGWNTRVASNITVQLSPAFSVVTLPSLPATGWNPARTFEQAFGVFASVFTFIVDLLIWVVVIVGPFVLMGLGVRAVVRRMRR